MAPELNRRHALGLAIASAGAATMGINTPAVAQAAVTPRTAEQARERVAEIYQKQRDKAGGIWNSYISIANPDGSLAPAVEDEPEVVVEAYSVNKLAVATAVLDKVDRSLLTLDHRVDVAASLVIPNGDGMFRLDNAYPSSVTLGHVLANLLTISDDTAVALCGLVCPARELNEIMRSKGFANTQVKPVANPNRFFLGKTTPRETHDLLTKLIQGSLLSASSTNYLLTLLRSPVAFTDGIRRTMSSDERLRVATKAGWFNNGRNEAGIMFDNSGKALLTYALFAHGQDDPNNFGATHPAVEARAVMGREFLDALEKLQSPTVKAAPAIAYKPHNGG